MNHPEPPDSSPRPPCGKPIVVTHHGKAAQIGVCNLPAPHLPPCHEIWDEVFEFGPIDWDRMIRWLEEMKRREQKELKAMLHPKPRKGDGAP